MIAFIKRLLHIYEYETCEWCNGTGRNYWPQLSRSVVCGVCKGTGRRRVRR